MLTKLLQTKPEPAATPLKFETCREVAETQKRLEKAHPLQQPSRVPRTPTGPIAALVFFARSINFFAPGSKFVFFAMPLDNDAHPDGRRLYAVSTLTDYSMSFRHTGHEISPPDRGSQQSTIRESYISAFKHSQADVTENEFTKFGAEVPI